MRPSAARPPAARLLFLSHRPQPLPTQLSLCPGLLQTQPSCSKLSALLPSATMHPDLEGGGGEMPLSRTHIICKQARSKSSQDLSLIQEATPEAGVNLTAGLLLFRTFLQTFQTCFLLHTPWQWVKLHQNPLTLLLWFSTSLARSLRLAPPPHPQCF